MQTRGRVFPRAETVTAAVVAWLALNAFSYAAAPLFGISFGLVGAFFGSLLFPGSSPVTQVWVGRALFLVAAVIWSVVYRRVQPLLGGPGWFRGLVFGAAVWVVTGLLLPLLGAVHPLGANAFGAAAAGVAYPGWFGVGFDGGAGVALSVLAHLVFGMTLGVLLRRYDHG